MPHLCFPQDHDRRVREATQQAFEKLILKVKKHLAPYLKSLMGYWLMAQCDPYSPAAFAAKDAFEAAFPPTKQPEAIAFCKDEITTVSFGSHSVILFFKYLKNIKHNTMTVLLAAIVEE